ASWSRPSSLWRHCRPRPCCQPPARQRRPEAVASTPRDCGQHERRSRSWVKLWPGSAGFVPPSQPSRAQRGTESDRAAGGPAAPSLFTAARSGLEKLVNEEAGAFGLVARDPVRAGVEHDRLPVRKLGCRRLAILGENKAVVAAAEDERGRLEPGEAT